MHSGWEWPLKGHLVRVTLVAVMGLMMGSEALVSLFRPAAPWDLSGTLAIAVAGLLLFLTTEVAELRRLAGAAAVALATVALLRFASPDFWAAHDPGLLLVRSNMVLLAGLLLAPSAASATVIALLTLVIPLMAMAQAQHVGDLHQLRPVTYTLCVGGVGYVWVIHLLKRRTQGRLVRLRRLAELDDLTGLLNRHAFLAQADQRVAECFDQGQPAGLLYLDADRFKHINDTYGHAAGDQVLVALAHQLTLAAGPDALVGRLGGEEFGVLWPGLDELSCHRRALALQAGLRPKAPVPVTVSVGLAADEDPRLESLLRRAEQGLRAAKQAGRDQVMAGLITPIPADPESD